MPLPPGYIPDTPDNVYQPDIAYGAQQHKAAMDAGADIPPNSALGQQLPGFIQRAGESVGAPHNVYDIPQALLGLYPPAQLALTAKQALDIIKSKKADPLFPPAANLGTDVGSGNWAGVAGTLTPQILAAIFGSGVGGRVAKTAGGGITGALSNLPLGLSKPLRGFVRGVRSTWESTKPPALPAPPPVDFSAVAPLESQVSSQGSYTTPPVPLTGKYATGGPTVGPTKTFYGTPGGEMFTMPPEHLGPVLDNAAQQWIGAQQPSPPPSGMFAAGPGGPVTAPTQVFPGNEGSGIALSGSNRTYGTASAQAQEFLQNLLAQRTQQKSLPPIQPADWKLGTPTSQGGFGRGSKAVKKSN